MKLLRPLAGYTLYDHKTNDYICRELGITGILDKIRWIQTELASALTKNTTKLNPFEIIPLQTTRKENNWKTEEALTRGAPTLETERNKGSNPLCLWWWIIIALADHFIGTIEMWFHHCRFNAVYCYLDLLITTKKIQLFFIIYF